MASTPLILIDGYNVILSNAHIDSNDENALWRAREDLVRRLIACWGHKKIRITVVFDGRPDIHVTRLHRPANLRIVFSRAPQQADHVILNLIKQDKHPQNTILVTSDRKLAHDGISLGVRHWPASRLISKIVSQTTTRHVSAKYDRPMSADEIKEWKNIFNLKEDDRS